MELDSKAPSVEILDETDDEARTGRRAYPITYTTLELKEAWAVVNQLTRDTK